MVLLLLVGALLQPSILHAAGRSGQTRVRVGYYQLDGFQNRSADGKYSGYGYDFLRKTTWYLNVHYEYEGYGEYSFGQMLDQLEQEKIDLMVGVIDRTARRERFTYSEPMGTRVGTLFARKDDNKIVSGDYKTYDKMRVGVLVNSSLRPEFGELAKNKGFSYSLKSYTTFEELNQALKEGEVDSILTCFRSDISDKKVLERLDSKDYYAIVKKGNESLLKDINYAITQLNNTDGNWMNTLDDKYYTTDNVRNLAFTEEEWKIIEKYRKGGEVLTVACSADRKPYSYVEDGKMTGIIPEYFDKLAHYAGLSYEMKIPKSRAEYAKWQQDVEADVFIDARIVDENEVEAYHATTTVPYITMRLALVTRKDFDGELKSLAVTEEQGSFGVEEHISKGLKVQEVDSREEAMKAVLEGKVDGTVVYLYTAQEYVNRNADGLLTYSLLENPIYQYCMVVTKNVPQELAGILTKCIYAMSDSTLEELAENYTRYKTSHVDLITWLRLYPMVGIVLVLILMIVGVLVFVAIERQVSVRKERKRSAELTTLNAEAQAESRAKSLFFANMSHDLRTPMNAIMGLVSIMEEEPELSEAMRQNLQKVQASGGYLLSIINNVLDMSKIESREVELMEEPANLREEILQVESMIRSQSEKKAQYLEIRMDSLQHEYLIFDSIRLKQVMVNLLSNAVKYTPPGGEIRWTIQELESKQPEFARYEFVVQDNGIGMTKEYLEQVYEPFSRSESSMTSKEQGTGLGLAITKSIVDLMGGEIQVESEEGNGTTFTVLLQLQIDSATMEEECKGQEQKAEQNEKKNVSILEGKHFLCAEDNALNAEILEALLKRKGAICTICADGEELVKTFAQVHPGDYDAILMDVQMPKMNGYEATRAIRRGKNPLGKQIPIIAMTANAFSEDVRQSQEAGMNAHISKPIDVARIEVCLKQILAGTHDFSGGGQRTQKIETKLGEKNEI